MASTLTDIFRVLKEIRDKEVPTRILSGGQRALEFSTLALEALVTTTNTTLSSISTLISTLDTVVDSILTNLTTLSTNWGNTNLENIAARQLHSGKSSARWLSEIDTNTQGLAAVDFATTAKQDVQETTLNAIQVSTANILSELENDITNELSSIDANWNLLSLNQLNLAAILVAVLNNSTSSKQDDMITELREQSNRNYAYIATYTVTDISSGTLFEIKIQVASGQSLDKVVVGIRNSVGNSSGTVHEYHTSDGVDLRTVRATTALGAGVWAMTPENNVEEDENRREWNVGAAMEIRISFTSVAVDDVLTVAVTSKCRTSTLPTSDTAASSAVVTESIKREAID